MLRPMTRSASQSAVTGSAPTAAITVGAGLCPIGALLGPWNVAAPVWTSVNDGCLPGLADSVAQTAQPVFLLHTIARRGRETCQRMGRKVNFLQTGTGKR